MKQIDIPGQGVVEFPDSMTDEQIVAAIKKMPSVEVSRVDGPSQQDIERFANQKAPYGFGNEMLSGLTFGFGDELRAKVTGEPIEAIRAGQQAYREENPIASLGAQALGGLPTLALPVGLIGQGLRGIGMAGNVARGAGAVGTGAAYGAASGAGEAVEGERATGATKGAIVGSILSPVGAGVGRGIQMAASKARGKAATMLPQDKAQAILLGRLEAAGMTPEQARQKLLQDMSLGELSPTLTSLTGSVVRRVPEAKEQFAQQAAEAKMARPQQLLGRVQQELGAPDATISMLEEATQRSRQAAQPLYQRAYEEAAPILLDESLVKRPSVQKAFGVVNNMRAERGLPPVDLTKPISLQDADLLKRAMDEVLYVGKMPTSGLGPAILRDMKETRSLFVNSIDNQAPESYRAARQIYAGGARDQEAVDLGRDVWKKGPEYVQSFMRGASESEKAAFRAAANAELRAMSEKLGPNREAFRALMDTPRAQQIVQQLTTTEGPSAVPALVGRQRAQAGFEQQVSGGSQTAERVAADEALGLLNESIPEQVIRKGPVRAGVDLATQFVVDRSRLGFNNTAAELGPLLLNKNRADNLETLRRLDVLKDNLSRMAGQRAGAYGAGAGLSGLLSQ